ncbi:hypothetical protein BJ944DRAFT_272588 [Cunninghamella echinulata]|nr:hypothetical protein BJ944DRAFT_272588 [Cunninghamella echinulata]
MNIKLAIMIVMSSTISITLGKGFGETCSIDINNGGGDDLIGGNTHCSESGLVCTQDDCEPGLVCGQGNKCKFDHGAKCKTNDECGYPLCYEGTCSWERGPGTQCKLNADCYGGLICKGGICGYRTYKKPGEACTSVVECEYGCIDGKCSSASSKGSCNNDIDCPSGSKCVCGSCCTGSVSECAKAARGSGSFC